jgi:hypothetical protein
MVYVVSIDFLHFALKQINVLISFVTHLLSIGVFTHQEAQVVELSFLSHDPCEFLSVDISHLISPGVFGSQAPSLRANTVRDLVALNFPYEFNSPLYSLIGVRVEESCVPCMEFF